MTKCLSSFFEDNISQRTKNITFFIVVLQILMMISGTVHTNPGSVDLTKTNLSIAVWNVNSIPARDYARIPLIESFQVTYDFDIFGVCESLLNKDIHNADLSFGLTNLKIVGTVEFVYIIKKTCQLSGIWNPYLKQ